MHPFRFVIPAAALTMASVCAAQGSDPVEVEGGADASGQNYKWDVRNGSDSAIVSIEIPHFRGGVETAPDGWGTELTHPRGAGGRAGVFKASAKSARDGIAPGRSKSFRLIITAAGTPRGHGEITVRFDNGEVVRVSAELPVKASLADRNVSLIGLSLIFGIFVFVRFLRGRKRAIVDVPAQPTAPDS